MHDDLAILGGKPVIERPHAERWPVLNDQHKKAVMRLLDAGEISYYGREGAVAELEDLWSSRLGGRPVLAVSSGTAALHSAYFALGAEPGDEVICPTNTFLATVTPLLQLGATPVLCDSEPRTGNLDPAQLDTLLTKRTVGVAVTHLWGHPAAMSEIVGFAEKACLWIVEDCSHAHGATYRGREVGTLGDAAGFSLQASKIVFAGQGGLLASRAQETHERACLVGHFRVRAQQDVKSELRRYAGTGFGLNYRMHPLAAVLALISSQDMESAIALRTSLLRELGEALSEVPDLVLPVTLEDCTRGAFYGFKVGLSGRWRTASRDRIAEGLSAEGLDVHRPGSMPLHLLPLFADDEVPLWRRHPLARRVYAPGDLPVAEDLWTWSLSLPTFSHEEERPLIPRYAEAFAKVYERIDSLAATAGSRDGR